VPIQHSAPSISEKSSEPVTVPKNSNMLGETPDTCVRGSVPIVARTVVGGVLSIMAQLLELWSERSPTVFTAETDTQRWDPCSLPSVPTSACMVTAVLGSLGGKRSHRNGVVPTQYVYDSTPLSSS